MVTKISQFLNTTFSTLSVDDATNNAVSYPGVLIHTTTATPAVGIGVGLQFQAETATTNTETGMTIEAVTTDVTAASEDFDFVVRLMQNGAAAAERFRVTSAGAGSLTGALTAGSFAPTSASVPTNGMYLSTTNTLGFSTGGSNRMVVEPTGNVGIGYTNPTFRLDIATPTTDDGIIVRNIDSTATTTKTSTVRFGGRDTVSTDKLTGTVAVGPIDNNYVNSYMAFVTRSSDVLGERMRINNLGNVSIGTTSSSARLSVVRDAGTDTFGEIYTSDGTQWLRIGSNFSTGAYNNMVGTGDHAIIYSNGTQGTGAFTIAPWSTATSGIRIDNNGNVSIGLASVTAGYELDVGGSVRVAGGIVATGEITAYFSDQRLKANITAITNAVDKVMAINGVYYNANDLAVEIAGEDKTIQRVGLLAQEVEAVLPHVVKAAPFDIGDNGVSKTGEHYKTLQYERIVPLLVEAIKEQQQQIEKLNERITLLETSRTNG